MALLNFDINSICYLKFEEERLFSIFTRRLIEIAASGARKSHGCPVTMLNAMSVPAIALDRQGFVVSVNMAAQAVFDDDVKIKEGRLFIRDRAARARLKKALDELKKPRLVPLAVKPFVVWRADKFPFVLRIWSFAGPDDLSAHFTKTPVTETPVHSILSFFPILPVRHQPPYLM